jgi:hypothetical protein
MDAANKADRKLGYELAIAQNISIEKIVRAWLEKRFRVLKDLKDKGICSFVAVSGGCGFKIKFNSANYEEYLETLTKSNISHWGKNSRGIEASVMLKGFFSHTIIFQLDRYKDTVSKLAQYHNNIDTLEKMHCKVQIPEYLF